MKSNNEFKGKDLINIGIYAAHADSYRTDRSRRSHDAVLHQGQEIWHS